MQIEPEDLRIGNLVYYQTSEDGLMPNVIDWEDIRHSVENPGYFNDYYKGIPMNWALCEAIGLSFKEDHGVYGIWTGFIGEWGVFELTQDGNGYWFNLNTTMGINIKYFHQLENALYCSTGNVFFPNRKLLKELLEPSKLVTEILSDVNKQGSDIRSDALIPSNKQFWKHRVDVSVDLVKLQSLGIKDKIFYLATCGWRIEKEMRNGNFYLYAIKYINRKKQRIYICKEIDMKELL